MSFLLDTSETAFQYPGSPSGKALNVQRQGFGIYLREVIIDVELVWYPLPSSAHSDFKNHMNKVLQVPSLRKIDIPSRSLKANYSPSQMFQGLFMGCERPLRRFERKLSWGLSQAGIPHTQSWSPIGTLTTNLT